MFNTYNCDVGQLEEWKRIFFGLLPLGAIQVVNVVFI